MSGSMIVPLAALAMALSFAQPALSREVTAFSPAGGSEHCKDIIQQVNGDPY